MGWQLPAMRCTTLGTADVPTVSSPGRGDQLHRVAQSAELPEARAGRPSRAAAERRAAEIPRDAGKGSMRNAPQIGRRRPRALLAVALNSDLSRPCWHAGSTQASAVCVCVPV